MFSGRGAGDRLGHALRVKRHAHRSRQQRTSVICDDQLLMQSDPAQTTRVLTIMRADEY